MLTTNEQVAVSGPGLKVELETDLLLKLRKLELESLT